MIWVQVCAWQRPEGVATCSLQLTDTLPAVQVHGSLLALSCNQAVFATPGPSLEGGADPDGRVLCCNRPPEVHVM